MKLISCTSSVEVLIENGEMIVCLLHKQGKCIPTDLQGIEEKILKVMIFHSVAI